MKNMGLCLLLNDPIKSFVFEQSIGVDVMKLLYLTQSQNVNFRLESQPLLRGVYPLCTDSGDCPHLPDQPQPLQTPSRPGRNPTRCRLTKQIRSAPSRNGFNPEASIQSTTLSRQKVLHTVRLSPTKFSFPT